MYLEPLLLGQRVTVVHLFAMAGAAAEHLLLFLFTGQSLHLCIVLDDPRRELVLLHQARFPLGVSGLLAPAVQVHALRGAGQGTEGERREHGESWGHPEGMWQGQASLPQVPLLAGSSTAALRFLARTADPR